MTATATPGRAGWSRLVLVLAVLAAPLLGCGGGAGGGTDDAAQADQGTPVNAKGRLALAAISGATVEVFRVGNYATPVATATTSDGAALEEIGRFSFTLQGVPANALFLLVAEGGMAHDEDEDGTLDGPTPVLGRVHAIASAAELGRGIVMSAVTDVMYHRVRYALEALYDETYVAEACDSWATFMLRTSIVGGPAIDNGDALAYDPAATPAATFRPHDDFVDYVQYVLLGTASAPDAWHLSEEEISFQTTPQQVWGVELVGDLAYVCSAATGLVVWDVSNPRHVLSVGHYDTPGTAVKVQIVGTRAYVADGEAGLQILDVSSPSAPTRIGSLAVGGWVTDVHVVGNRAYLADSDGSDPMLHIVDVTTPSAPALLSDYPLESAPNKVRVEGTLAYVMKSSEVEVVDVSDPLLPVRHGSTDVDSYARMDVALGHLFVASGPRLEVFALPSASNDPVSVATLTLNGLSVSGIRILGTRAALSTSPGIALVDVADPANPSFLGLIPTTGSVYDVAGTGSLFMVTYLNGAMSPVAAGTPVPSGVVASVPMASYVDSLQAVGNRLYMATSAPSALVVYDTTNPLAPTFLGGGQLASNSGKDIAVSGRYAFVAEQLGLELYDVSDPTNPVNVDGESPITSLQSLALGDDVVYATDGERIQIYDLPTPGNLRPLGSLPVAGQGRGLAFSEGALVLAAGSQGVYTFDAIPPTAPTQEARVDLWETNDVSFNAPYAVVTQMPGWWNRGNVVVFDCTDLSAPISRAQVALPSLAHKVVRQSGYAYVTSWAAGIQVVDVGNPQEARHVGTIPVPSFVQSIDVEGAFIYVAGGWPDTRVDVLRAAQVEVP